jgi:hypothetical protein
VVWVRALGLVALLATSAVAEPQPWAVDVTDEQKTRAHELLDAGNAKLVDRDYVGALGLYEEAIRSWDHPAIRFNMVRCLIQLDRPLEAAENLEHALAYGAAPLEDIVYSEALAYRKLLATQVSDLEVRCVQPGARLTLDGKPLGTCPATIERRLEPGAHQIVAVLDGHLPRTVDVVLAGGAKQTIDVTLVSLASAAVERQRWRSWVPWTVFGSGLGVAVLGGLVVAKAASDLDAYDRNVATTCGRTGCTGATRDALRDQEASAILESRIGIGVVVAGGAAAIAGGVMLYFNRPTTEYPRLELAPMPRGVAVRGWF